MNTSMSLTVRDAVDRQAALRPDAAYLVAPETGRTMTFGQLQQASRRLARWLASQGIAPGEKVALMMHNGYQSCRLFIGAMYAGCCVTPLNLLAQPSQLSYVLSHCDARLIFASPDQIERLEAAQRSLERPLRIVPCPVDDEEFLDFSDDGAPLAALGENDDALMMYTSGTTGKPKGVVLSHRSVVAGGRFVSEAHRLTADDRVMAVLPLYHINAQIVTATAPLIHGGSLVLPHRFSATIFWQQVVAHRCTWINVVPTIIGYLVNGPDAQALGLSLDGVRFCRSASAPLPPSQHREFEAKFGIGIIETMGLTETAAPAFTNPLDPARRKIGSPGQAFGNEATICDAAGITLPSGMTGEIMIRGPNVMKGYYKDPAASSAAITDEGWLHTGDLGHMDEDGFVFVTGRIKELIIKGGENIAPREIDEVVIQHPAIAEVATVGIPDDRYGQDIAVFVVVRAGSCCEEDDLRELCKRELGAYKTPKLFRFVEELPKGPSGKVQRLKLLDVLNA